MKLAKFRDKNRIPNIVWDFISDFKLSTDDKARAQTLLKKENQEKNSKLSEAFTLTNELKAF